MYLAYALLSRYDSDPLVRSYVDTLSWVIVPVNNADGYQYTFDSGNSWRKTRT